MRKSAESAALDAAELDDEAPWRETAKLILLSEMGRNLVRPAELAERLGMESATVVRNKINRATFSAGWFLLALHVLQVDAIRVPPEPMQMRKITRRPRKPRSAEKPETE
jgi:hypothetical protein